MKQKSLCSFLFTGIILLLLAAFPAMAADDESSWQVSPYFEIWGLGAGVNYTGFRFTEKAPTAFWAAFCFNSLEPGYYRNPDGTEYQPPGDGSPNLALYKNSNYLWSLGVSQGLPFGPEWLKPLRVCGYYKGRLESYTAGENGSLLLDSTLADREGILQQTLLVGLLYDGVEVNVTNQVRRGIYAELSWETAPTVMNEIAAFSRLNANLTGFLPLMESDGVCIIAGNRLLYDQLTGATTPVNARTSFGGIGVFPGLQTAGLGGEMRGIAGNRFDGQTKMVNNFDLRITLPHLVPVIIPGVLAFADVGISDDWNRIHTSIGGGVTVNLFGLDFVLMEQYYMNDEELTLGFSLGHRF